MEGMGEGIDLGDKDEDQRDNREKMKSRASKREMRVFGQHQQIRGTWQEQLELDNSLTYGDCDGPPVRSQGQWLTMTVRRRVEVMVARNVSRCVGVSLSRHT